MPTRLGIVAGGGLLPGHIAHRCREQGREVFIVALEQQADPAVVEPWPHVWVRLGAAGTAIRHLREAGVEEVVMAGPVRRPSLSELRPDGRALRFLARGALSGGDDGLLSAVVRTLEEDEGFRIVSVQDVAGGLLARHGKLGAHEPGEDDQADIARGVKVLSALGAVDVGQAVVVQAGVVLGVEAIEGTDALIRRCGDLRRQGKGPVLIKLAKDGQEQRVDLPTIGPETVAGCRDAGFSGIAVEAGRSLIVDRDAAIAAADAAGMFLVGLRLDAG
jgi:UDP-2,3-diacylglucosamine hydrolase